MPVTLIENMNTDRPPSNRKKLKQLRKKTAPPPSAGSGAGASNNSNNTGSTPGSGRAAPPDPNEIINRDDYTITSPSRYKFIFSSPGPPLAEIHLVTAAHLVLPDTKMVCKLDDSIIPQLVEQRMELMRQDAEDEKRKNENLDMISEENTEKELKHQPSSYEDECDIIEKSEIEAYNKNNHDEDQDED